MIGDEVMFVVDNVADAARIGLDLADAYADDDLLSDVRVGLARGPVLFRDGDYFGPTVNLAHRIVNIGNPGTVLMSDEFHAALMEEAPGEFTPRPYGRACLRTSAGAAVVVRPDRPGGRRHRRGGGPRATSLGAPVEVLRDLEELRGVGERLLTANRAGSQRREAGRWRSRRAVARTTPRRAARVAPQVDQPAGATRHRRPRSARAWG